MMNRFCTTTILATLCLLAAVATAIDVGVLTDIAEYFNVPVENVTPDTRFTEDLLADPVDVFELVVTLCSLRDLQPPDDLPTTVADLVQYLRTASPVPESVKDLEDEGMIHVQDVLYATTRASDPDGERGDAYGGARSRSPSRPTSPANSNRPTC